MTVIALEVPAGEPWVDTGVDLKQGDRIEIRARGLWRDAGIECDAQGHDAVHLRLFRSLRRCRTARWLQLTACVTRDLRHAAPVGTTATYSAPVEGRLYLFANDARGMYWNNRGLAQVQVSLVDQHQKEAGGAAPGSPAWPSSGTGPSVAGSPASGARRPMAQAAGWLAAVLAILGAMDGTSLALQPDPDDVSGDAAAVDPLAQDPFAQFDLGVAVVTRDEGVPEWAPLAETGVELSPETAIVSPGDTVDSLLIARGVRADPYSRELVGILNPRLDDRLRLAVGEPVTVFRADGLPSGRLLALQPYQEERRRIAATVASFDDWMRRLDDVYSEPEVSRISVATDRLIHADLAAIRTQPEQLLAAEASLGRYQNVLASAGSDHTAFRDIIAQAGMTAAAVRPPRTTTRTSKWHISVTGPGTVSRGYCRLFWAIGGYTGHPGSGDEEPLPLEGPFDVPPALLMAWVQKQGREISPRLTVRREQLLATDVRRDVLVTNERCDQ